MELGKGSADLRRKRIIQVAFMAFMGLLLFFTLFSNTLQSLTLPKVTTEQPKKGGILFAIEGSGILQPVAEAKLSSSTDWKVQQVLVKERDRVKKGQQLIMYDSQAARQEMELEITNLEKQKIEQQNLQDQFIQSSIEEDELNLRNAGREIEKGKLDIAAQERKIKDMRERLLSDQQLTAPFDGIVSKVNAVEGMPGSGEPDVIVSNSSQGYRFEVPADARHLASLGVSIGEPIEVEVDTAKGEQALSITGTIEEIVQGEPLTQSLSDDKPGGTITIQQKILRIKVVHADLKGGEQAWMKLEKSSLLRGLIISNEAVHQDREGMYVYKVDEQRGTLGNVFVARRVNIKSSEKNDKETMIQSDSIYEEDKIILKSSDPLQDGNRIRLE